MCLAFTFCFAFIERGVLSLSPKHCLCKYYFNFSSQTNFSSCAGFHPELRSHHYSCSLPPLCEDTLPCQIITHIDHNIVPWVICCVSNHYHPTTYTWRISGGHAIHIHVTHILQKICYIARVPH